MTPMTDVARPRTRRSPLRGLPLAYDPILRRRIVRILVYFGGLRALVEGDRITDSWLLYHLGLEATSQSPQPYVVIKHALQHLLVELEKKAIKKPKETAFAKNLAELAKTLDLSPVEQDTVFFITACHYSQEISRVIQQLRELRLPEAFHVVTCAVGRPFGAVSKVLAPSSKLISSGLLQLDSEMGMGFESMIRLPYRSARATARPMAGKTGLAQPGGTARRSPQAARTA